MQIKHTEYTTTVIIDDGEYSMLGLYNELPDWFLSEKESLTTQAV